MAYRKGSDRRRRERERAFGTDFSDRNFETRDGEEESAKCVEIELRAIKWLDLDLCFGGEKWLFCVERLRSRFRGSEINLEAWMTVAKKLPWNVRCKTGRRRERDRKETEWKCENSEAREIRHDEKKRIFLCSLRVDLSRFFSELATFAWVPSSGKTLSGKRELWTASGNVTGQIGPFLFLSLEKRLKRSCSFHVSCVQLFHSSNSPFSTTIYWTFVRDG